MSLDVPVWTIIRRMIVTLQSERLRTVEQIEAFLGGNAEVDFKPEGREVAYGFARRTLVRLGYASLDRPGKGAVREYLVKTTGFSRTQVTRLIAQRRERGRIEDRRGGNSGRPFARVYRRLTSACWPRPTRSAASSAGRRRARCCGASSWPGFSLPA